MLSKTGHNSAVLWGLTFGMLAFSLATLVGILFNVSPFSILKRAIVSAIITQIVAQFVAKTLINTATKRR